MIGRRAKHLKNHLSNIYYGKTLLLVQNMEKQNRFPEAKVSDKGVFYQETEQIKFLKAVPSQSRRHWAR